MPVFGSPSFTLHRQVAFCNDPKVGLRAIIAIHDTTLGPALGGCRMWPYGSEDEAVEDVLRLARGMTYKAALAGIALGGGKSVIIGDPARDKSAAMFESFGRFVAGLGGCYIVAEDVGTSVADLQIVHRETEHVRGIPETGGGDPSPVTAFGVYHGVRAAVRHRLGRHSLAGVRVAVQGLGHVGLELCRRLGADGAGSPLPTSTPKPFARCRGPGRLRRRVRRQRWHERRRLRPVCVGRGARRRHHPAPRRERRRRRRQQPASRGPPRRDAARAVSFTRPTTRSTPAA